MADSSKKDYLKLKNDLEKYQNWPSEYIYNQTANSDIFQDHFLIFGNLFWMNQPFIKYSNKL